MIVVLLALITVVSIGLILKQTSLDVEDTRKNINFLVLYIFLPALIFKIIYTSQVGREFYQIPIVVSISIISCLIITSIATSLLKLKKQQKGVILLAGCFGNVTYFGLPILQGTFPDNPEIVKVAILAEITTTAIILTLGSLLASYYSKKQERSSLRESLTKIVKMPALWSVIIALLLNLLGVPIPEFIIKATHLMGNTVAGLMILSLGMSLQFKSTHWAVTPLIVIVISKLILSPLIGINSAELIGLGNEFKTASILETAMPTQLLTLVISEQFGLDTQLLASCILATTLISTITIPNVYSWL